MSKSAVLLFKGVGSWRKTDSLRLNSRAIFCFCSSVKVVRRDAGTRTTAKGLPIYGVVVKTSRVVKGSCILIDGLARLLFDVGRK